MLGLVQGDLRHPFIRQMSLEGGEKKQWGGACQPRRESTGVTLAVNDIVAAIRQISITR